MSKIKELFNKHKKSLIVSSVALGLVAQLGGFYVGYKVYDKFEKIDRTTRIVKRKIKSFEKHEALVVESIGRIVDILDAHGRIIKKLGKKWK